MKDSVRLLASLRCSAHAVSLIPLPRPDRIFALGRNEAGQLGVGFASQEGTRALVEGFEGEQILAVKAGVQSSYILVRDGGARASSSSELARSASADRPLAKTAQDSTRWGTSRAVGSATPP